MRLSSSSTMGGAGAGCVGAGCGWGFGFAFGFQFAILDYFPKDLLARQFEPLSFHVSAVPGTA